MANFAPLKRSLLSCVDEAMRRMPIAGPFLDIGCGSGDVSAHLASKGLTGTAVDLSAAALVRAREQLAGRPVTVLEGPLPDDATGFGVVLMMDVIEHVEDDKGLLNDAIARLADGGYLIISVPSNPREWRWDDDFYGHLRRYSAADITALIESVGFRTRIVWDFTFPTFWMMRRMYTGLKKPPRQGDGDEHTRTLASSTENAFHIPLLAPLLNSSGALFRPIVWAQFKLFRNRHNLGHQLVVVAERATSSAR